MATLKREIKPGKKFLPSATVSTTDYRLVYRLGFLGFAIYLLILKNGFFLKWAEELSLFLYSCSFFKESMRFAGGLLIYGGTFLTQFFYYPALGGIIFIALLFLIHKLTLIAFHIPAPFYPLSFIPGLMLLLSVTQLGYVWVTLKSPGYLFSNVLGVVAFLLCFAGYRKLKKWWQRFLALVILVSAGYPLLGFYSLFSGFTCILYELFLFFKSKGTFHLIPILAGILLLVFIPQIYFFRVYDYMQYFYIYTAVLPRFLFSWREFVLWLPFVIMLVSFILFLLFFPDSREKGKSNTVSETGSLIVFVLAIFAVYFLSYNNENFRAEVKMNAAIEKNNWKKVLIIAGNLRGTPTQNIVLDYNLAAMESHAKANNFNESAILKIKSVRPVEPILSLYMSGRPFLYFTGEINDCYRWSMEDIVEYGTKVSYLKYLVKCAILNGEYELAQKYNTLMAETLFYKDWAQKYQSYIDNPRLIESDREMAVIRALSNK